MTGPAARRAAVRLAHLAVPHLLRWAAVRDPAAAATRRPLDSYDRATAVLAGATGRAGAALGGAALLAVRLDRQHPARVLAVAGAEELVWRTPAPRSPAAAALGVLGFALVHAPAAPRSWPYHLLTGTVLTVVSRAGGPVAATAVHAAHNLVLVHRERVQRTAPRPAAVPALPAAGDWPALT